MIANKVGQVVSTAPNALTVEILDLQTFEKHKADLQIGCYLRIAQGNNDFTIAIINSIKGTNSVDNTGNLVWRFQIECQPIGILIDNEKFVRGSQELPVPTEPVYTADIAMLEKIFAGGEGFIFPLGTLLVNKKIDFKIDGDRFFSKHIAIVGSTGSGKSCAVTKILHDAVGINAGQNIIRSAQNNSHIVIFDLHDEYKGAFALDREQSFTLNALGVDSLKIPYWLMNAEELESMFIESNEQNSHNQVSQFKKAVIANKERHNPEITKVTYDMPVYFSLQEVYNYIYNMNQEVIGRRAGENKPKLADGSLIDDRSERYFAELLEFAPQSQAKDDKASNGSFHGEFNRFISRLETRMEDKRLGFLLASAGGDEITYKTADLPSIVKQFVGYLNRSNVTIVDMSGIPFEVLSITVSLISRLIFDFCFHYTKLRCATGQRNDIPVLIVCEEAHNYIPQSDAAAYRASRKSIERIAKEGRKYGLSLMIVSQRPSEVSDTIFAQCNNFLALRLTNSADQAYVQRLFPDNSRGISESLPNLGPGECIVVGDAVTLPAIVQMALPQPQPDSQSVKFHSEWREPWRDVSFEDVIGRWRRE